MNVPFYAPRVDPRRGSARMQAPGNLPGCRPGGGVLVFVVILGCLFPLAAYCLLLGALNRSRHPVLVPGAWDFAGVLFGASGFLLLVGPFVLATLEQRWREHWLHDPAVARTPLSGWGWYVRLAAWAGYFVAVIAIATWALRRRRRATAVYNIESGVLPPLLAAALERQGLAAAWTGDRMLLGTPPAGTAAPTVRLETFPRMRHATLHWPAEDDALRRRVEAELARALAEMPVGPNPAAGWFLTVAACLLAMMGAMLLGLGTLYVVLRLRAGW